MEKRRRNPSTLEGYDTSGKAFGSDGNPPTDVNADAVPSQTVHQMSARDATPEWGNVGGSGVGGEFEGGGVDDLGKAPTGRVLPLPAKFHLSNGFSHRSLPNGTGNETENGNGITNNNGNGIGNESGNGTGNGIGNGIGNGSANGRGNENGNEIGSGRGIGNGSELRNRKGVDNGEEIRRGTEVGNEIGHGIVNGVVHGVGVGGLARDSISRKSSINRQALGDAFMSHVSNPSARPTVSPVESLLGVPASSIGAHLKTPRAKSGLEVESAGSLWDRSTMSPIQPQPTTPTATAPLSGMRRDQFEDALVRALDSKWESNHFTADDNNPIMRGRGGAVSRAQSFSEGGSKPNAMLAAGRCWTCVCTFENTVGQTACLGCGRIAPMRRPKTPLLNKKRIPPHRMQSWIPPSPMDV